MVEQMEILSFILLNFNSKIRIPRKRRRTDYNFERVH